MNLSNNQPYRERARDFCVSSKALAVSPRLQKLKPAFRMSHSRKKKLFILL